MEYQMLFFFFFLTTTNAVGLRKQQELDRITALPGQPEVSFAQFSGYVTVNGSHGRALFYWLTEATSDADNKPLVLWLNGGPGCSSIAYGASEEIGPFRINKTASSLYLNKYSWNGGPGCSSIAYGASEEIGPFRINKTASSLYLNKYSWNGDANLLFLESPAGVGFSYSNTSSDLTDFGDRKTAEDALVFMVRWISRFPQYTNRELYIVGESYAGHYVPHLASKIVDYNKASPKQIINLTGIMIGNGDMHYKYDWEGKVSYWWTHSLISDNAYEDIVKSCNFSSGMTQNCWNLLSYAVKHGFGFIDQSSIYAPACTNISMAMRLNSGLLLHRRRLSEYDPCAESYAEKYYNRPDVQKALHANSTGIPYKWTDCSNTILMNWKDYEYSMLPTYNKLIATGLRIWVYSGDADSVVPITGTRLSLRHLNLKVKTEWYPWYISSEQSSQVGGRTEVYEGLTFATVRGAGHEVPLTQPESALVLFRSFLAGKPLPT